MPGAGKGRILSLFMFRSVLILCFCLLPIFFLRAQEATGLHTFTDKNGKQVLASLLSVSEDRRMMKIRREDGQEFELVINVLSLDDQQFIKDQLDTLPVEKKDFRLEMEIARKVVSAESYRYGSGSYTLKQEFLTWEVKLQNFSRETLEEARIEWVVVWDDRIAIVEEDDAWTYNRLAGDEEENQTAKSGEIALPPLPFNQDVSVTTGEIELNEMLYQRDVYRADEFLGVIARVVSAQGTVLAESRLGGTGFRALPWEAVLALDPSATADAAADD